MKETYYKEGDTWRKAVYIWKKIGGFWVRQFPWFQHNGWKECWTAPETAPDTGFLVDSGSFTVTNAGINLTNGTVSFNDAVSTLSMDLIIKVRVIHYTEGLKADVEYYNDPYTANDHIGAMSEVVFGPPIPSAGYIVRLEFNEAA